MSLPVDVSIANPDPNDNPTTLSQLVALFRTLISAVVPGSYLPYVVGAATPAVGDQDKLWMRIGSTGKPIGIYTYYGGRWVLPQPDLGNRIGLFLGDPAGGNFDGTGLGLPGAGAVASDYFGWAIANGNNGTPNWSDKFVIGGSMDNVTVTGYSAGVWRTKVTGVALNTGGVATNTLDTNTTYRPATGAVTAAHYTADGNTRDATGGIWGKDAGDGTGDPFDVIAADAGKPTPDPISNVPPFVAACYIFWVGYP